MVDFRSALSWIFGLSLLIYGLIPILNNFGVIDFQLPASILLLKIWVLLGASIWLVIDAFMEAHFIKTITMIFALIMLLMVAIPLLNFAGWIPFNLPAFVFVLENYVYTISGLLLIVGPFTYH